MHGLAYLMIILELIVFGGIPGNRNATRALHLCGMNLKKLEALESPRVKRCESSICLCEAMPLEQLLRRLFKISPFYCLCQLRFCGPLNFCVCFDAFLCNTTCTLEI